MIRIPIRPVWLIVCALFIAATAAVSHAQILGNGNFETPSVGAPGQSSSDTYGPAGATWAFTGNAGIAANGSSFATYHVDTPDGSQFAFLQGA